MIGWLGLLTIAVVVVVVAAALFALTRLTDVDGESRLGFGEALWQSMLRVVDAGTFAGDTNWWTRLLALLVTLAGIFIAGSLTGVRIVAKMLQQKHAPLAKATGADDFIVSDELTSLVVAQLSENHELDKVFRDLFDQGGSTIEIVNAERYGAHSADSGDIVLNPPKSEQLALTACDSLIVVSTSAPR